MHKTNQEHVQAVREGKDYYSPRLAVNETIDHLVDCALIVKNHEVPLTAETRALDAIGVQVRRELKNRADMIHALTDRLTAVEAELKAARELLADKGWVPHPVAEREIIAEREQIEVHV